MSKLTQDPIKLIKEAYNVPVAPLSGMVKGNTVDKIIPSALEFFSSKGRMFGAYVVKLTDSSGKSSIAAIFTSGDPESDIKSMNNKTIQRDQTRREIGKIEILGWFRYKDLNSIEMGGKINGSTKLQKAYTLK